MLVGLEDLARLGKEITRPTEFQHGKGQLLSASSEPLVQVHAEVQAAAETLVSAQ